ncbi:MAG: DNA recombination protein RmuC [Bacteroidetes bacterium]|nr:MAG: DNA recombination protein RmuC [Bacteroidota bacterium]
MLGIALGAAGVSLWLMRRQQAQQTAMARLEAERDQLQQQLSARETSLSTQAAELARLTGELSRLQAEAAHLQTELDSRGATLTQLETRFRDQFENLTRQLLDQHSQKLNEANQNQLGQLLNPLRDRLQQFEKRVEDSYQAEARERHSLKHEVERLARLNASMAEEARNLTLALKGDNKAQGNWGELVLTRVLEASGLQEGREYTLQGKDLQLHNADGRRQQPDVIIHLPEGKHLIIDAKVSLIAYERLVAAETPEQTSQALQQHLDSVRAHIRQLSDKHYAGLSGLQSPDFVLLFMPVEPAFQAALQAQQDLFSFAWTRKIVLVSPTTLLATLKTVASVWKLEQQNQNAEKIAQAGADLYDKFVAFIDDLKKVGTHLERAQRSQEDALRKLRDGRGSLTRRAEQLRSLGINPKKELDS